MTRRFLLCCGLLSLALLTACSTTTRLHLHGDIQLAHADSQIQSGIYTGKEMQKIKILGGHDLSRARSNLVVIGLGDQGSNVRLTYTNNGHNCDLRINSEALSASEELEVTIAVPGHGKTTRFFKIADSSNFDLEFLAVIPRR